MATKTNKKLGWHFLPTDMKLKYGDGRKAEVGKTLTYKGSSPPVCCYHGMHASPTASQAAQYTAGPVMTRVEVWGDINTQSDKFAGRHRKVLAARLVTVKDINGLITKLAVPSWKQYPLAATGTSADITAALKAIANYDATGFNKWAETFVGKGVHAAPFRKPRLDKKTLLSVLSPRLVQTKAEILKALGGAFQIDLYDDEDDVNDDDYFEDIVQNSSDVLVIDDFKVNGKYTQGYLRQ